jgi:hypothetical protein
MQKFFSIAVIGLCIVSSTRAAEPTFEEHVRPILKAYCFECHGEGESLKGGIDLRLKRFIEKGGKSGPGFVAGKLDQSILLQKIRKGDMPPGKKKLSPTELGQIEKWLASGARTKEPEPEALAGGFHITGADRAWWAFQPIKRPALPPASPNLARTPIDNFILAKLQDKQLTLSPATDKRTLIRRAAYDLTGLPPTPEEVENFANDQSPDAYEKLLDRLLASSAYGERWGRHWLDVAGYADSEGYSPEDPVRNNAWRFRDYVIRSINNDKPFNQFILEQLAGDELLKPPYANLKKEEIEILAATGFLRMAPDGTASGADPKIARNQVVADTIKIVSSSFLGLTVGCAQCHNHRYDPIPQEDYYRLRALLEPVYDVKNWRHPLARNVSLYTDADRKNAAEIEAEAAKIDKQRTARQAEFIEQTFQKEIAKLPEALREPAKVARNTPEAKRTAEQKKIMQEHPSLNVSAGSLYLYDSKAAAELKKMVDDATVVRAKKPVEEFIRAATEVVGQVPATVLFHRGDPDQPKQVIPPGGLSILETLIALKPTKAPELPSSGRRLALARWLTDRNHPLTARVLVNRVWMHHFGRGIVATPGDFGRLGERPTHPELLDWLAAEFMENGWSLKKLHKVIMTSAVYRQSSRVADFPAGADSRNPKLIDPDNRLLYRMNNRRLEAEGIRDAMLQVSGKLCNRQFGPPVPVRENDVGQFVVGKGKIDAARGTVEEEPLPDGEIFRRSVYVQMRRSTPVGVLETFDGAAMEPNCERRNSSTATPQSLLLLNSEFIQTQASFFAERVKKDAGDDVRAQVVRAWNLAYGVKPSDAELAAAVEFIELQTENFKELARHEKPPAKPKAPHKGKAPKEPPPLPEPGMRALTVFGQALLSSNRFLYVD